MSEISGTESETLRSIIKKRNLPIEKQKNQQSKNPCWNDDDLNKLERCISILGTDFDLIQKLFKNRTRKQIMNKYKKLHLQYNPKFRNKFNKIQQVGFNRHRLSSIDSLDFNIALEINQLINLE